MQLNCPPSARIRIAMPRKQNISTPRVGTVNPAKPIDDGNPQ